MAEPATERRSSGLWESPALGLALGAVAFAIASGLAHLFAAPALGGGSLLLVHRWVGALLYPVFLLVSVRHVARMAGKGFAALVLAAQALPIAGISTFVPPSFGLAAGVLLCVPLAIRFSRVAASEFRTHQVEGFVAFASTFAALFSGITVGLLGPEALAGDVLGWRYFGLLHRTLGIGCVAGLMWHLGRVRARQAGGSRLRPRVAVAAAIAFLVPCGVVYRGELGRIPSPEAAAGGSDARAVIHLADLHPGTGPPAIEPHRWHTAATCSSAGCHLAITQQWRVSAHRFSASNVGYRKVLELLVSEEGEGAAVLCSRCHDPVSVMLGLTALDDGELARGIRNEGISCAVCHLVTEVDPPEANGSLVLTLDDDPAVGAGAAGDASRFLARGLVAHSATYGLPHIESDAGRLRLCGACHRILTPPELNGGASFVQEDTVTEMREAKPPIAPSCDVCHMTLNQFEDPMHARPDHRVFGTLSMLEALAPRGILPPQELIEFDLLALRWRSSGLKLTRYDQAYTRLVAGPQEGPSARLLSGPRPIALTLRESPERVEPDSRLALEVVSRNGTAVHSVPTGPLGLNELWLELSVVDATGRQVFVSGALDASGRVTPDARRLGATLVDRAGNAITHDRLWRAVGTRDARLLPPGGEVVDRFEVSLDGSERAPLVVRARWRYRRYGAEMAEWVFGDVARVPIVDLADQQLVVDRG